MYGKCHICNRKLYHNARIIECKVKPILNFYSFIYHNIKSLHDGPLMKISPTTRGLS